jgi:hypothetical protein
MPTAPKARTWAASTSPSQANYEQQLVNVNQQALNVEVRQFKAAFARELSKLPALLRTASATLNLPGPAGHRGRPGKPGKKSTGWPPSLPHSCRLAGRAGVSGITRDSISLLDATSRLP